MNLKTVIVFSPPIQNKPFKRLGIHPFLGEFILNISLEKLRIFSGSKLRNAITLGPRFRALLVKSSYKIAMPLILLLKFYTQKRRIYYIT